MDLPHYISFVFSLFMHLVLQKKLTLGHQYQMLFGLPDHGKRLQRFLIHLGTHVRTAIRRNGIVARESCCSEALGRAIQNNDFEAHDSSKDLPRSPLSTPKS